MTDYEAEHNLPSHSASTIKPTPRRRPSLSTFYSSLRALETSHGEDGSNSQQQQQSNSNAVPLPVNVEASFVLLAEALTAQQLQPAGPAQDTDALDAMLDFLRSQAADPPTNVEGVSDAFLDNLERIDRKRLPTLKSSSGDGSNASCPICGDTFVSDPYPLVVRLPCHKDHVFDYECIRPWLKLNPTCPLDRKVLVKKKAAPPPKPADEDEEDYDDYFA